MKVFDLLQLLLNFLCSQNMGVVSFFGPHSMQAPWQPRPQNRAKQSGCAPLAGMQAPPPQCALPVLDVLRCACVSADP